MTPKTDLIGQVFGRLTILEHVGKRMVGKKSTNIYRAHCSCGTDTVVSQKKLVAGETRSCGCLHREHLQRHMRKRAGRISGGLFFTPEHGDE